MVKPPFLLVDESKANFVLLNPSQEFFPQAAASSWLRIFTKFVSPSFRVPRRPCPLFVFFLSHSLPPRRFLPSGLTKVASIPPPSRLDGWLCGTRLVIFLTPLLKHSRRCFLSRTFFRPAHFRKLAFEPSRTLLDLLRTP